MRRFLSLLKVSIREGFSSISPSSAKKRTRLQKLGMVLLFLLMAAYLIGFLGFASYGMAKSFHARGLGDAFSTFSFLSMTLVTIWIGLVGVPLILFFSEDTQVYMTMPFKPWEIALSKMVAAYLYGLLSMAMFGVPVLIGAMAAAFDLRALIGWILGLLALPFWPICLLGLVFLIILQLVPALRNKNRINFLMGLVMMALGILFYFGMMNFTKDITQESMIKSGLMAADSSAIKLGRILFPAVWGSQLMVNGTGVASFLAGLGLCLAVSIASLLLFSVLAGPLYFRVITSLSAGSERRKRISSDQRDRYVNRKTSSFRALLHWEKLLTMRVSAYMMNVVVSSLFLPFWFLIVLLVPLIQNWDEIMKMGLSLPIIQAKVGELMELVGGAMNAGLLVGGGIGFLTMMAAPTATAVTRDGRHIEALKVLPVSPAKIYLAQFSCAYLFGVLPGLLLLLLTLIPVGLRFDYLLPALLGLIVLSLTLAMIDYCIDVLSPKLDWQDEMKAVKQSKNAFVGLFLSMGLPVLLGLAIWKLSIDLRFVGPIVLSFCLVAFAVSTYLVFGRADQHFKKYHR